MSGRAAPAPHLSDRQRLHWLRLIRTENVGAASFRTLINRFGSAEAALEALPELMLASGIARLPRIPTEGEAESELEAARRFGARFVAVGEAGYPPMMQRMDHPPPLVAVKGDARHLRGPAVGIVGSRNASLAGTKLARMFASQLGAAGYVVVSGLARGIDAAAHEGSLASGTVAVLAGGLDCPYPPENVALAAEIAERGALVSERRFGHEPRSRDFPRRNRLIAGMGLGLVVVEAAMRSGSLTSARLANEIGRLVFAVPGSPLDPRAAGTNGLIRQGAIMATSTRDILDELAPLTRDEIEPGPDRALEEPIDFAAAPPPDMNDRSRMVRALGPVPTHVDDIIRHTGLLPAQVMMILLELDLAGRLERHAGGMVSLVAADT